MRLLPLGENRFEVHSYGHKVGEVWLFKGLWRGETVAGVPVYGIQGESERDIGLGVEMMHRKRGGS